MRIPRTLCFASFILLLTACGGGNLSSNARVTGASTAVFVTPMKGQFDAGATVTLRDNANQLYSGTVDATGIATLQIPNTAPAPYLITAGIAGDTYFDELTGGTGAIPAGVIGLRAVIPDLATLTAVSGVGVTVLTEMATSYIEQNGGIGAGDGVALAVSAVAATSAVASSFGMSKDQVFAAPSIIGKANKLATLTTPADLYALRLAALTNVNHLAGKQAIEEMKILARNAASRGVAQEILPATLDAEIKRFAGDRNVVAVSVSGVPALPALADTLNTTSVVANVTQINANRAAMMSYLNELMTTGTHVFTPSGSSLTVNFPAQIFATFATVKGAVYTVQTSRKELLAGVWSDPPANSVLKNLALTKTGWIDHHNKTFTLTLKSDGSAQFNDPVIGRYDMTASAVSMAGNYLVSWGSGGYGIPPDVSRISATSSVSISGLLPVNAVNYRLSGQSLPLDVYSLLVNSPTSQVLLEGGAPATSIASLKSAMGFCVTGNYFKANGIAASGNKMYDLYPVGNLTSCPTLISLGMPIGNATLAEESLAFGTKGLVLTPNPVSIGKHYLLDYQGLVYRAAKSPMGMPVGSFGMNKTLFDILLTTAGVPPF